MCICLLPGEHILEGLKLGGAEVHIHITACSPGTLVILKQPLIAQGLVSIRLSGFTVEAKGVPIAAVFERCQAVTFSDLTVTVTDVNLPEGAILFRGCLAVTLRNVAVTAKGVRQIFNFQDCTVVTLAACQLVGSENVGTIVSIGAGAERIHLDSNILETVAAKVALIIDRGNANTTLDTNIITGVTSLYGEPGDQLLGREELQSLAEKLKRRPDLLEAEKGVFQAQGNRLTRLVVADAKIQQIRSGGKVTGLYKAFFLTDNVIERPENAFVAEQVSVMSTFFVQTQQSPGERAGVVIGQATTFLGNHAPDRDVQLINVSSSHEEAANLMTIQHF